MDWKVFIHYATVGGLVVIGLAGTMGVHIPGVTIDPTMAFGAAAAAWTAGQMGPPAAKAIILFALTGALLSPGAAHAEQLTRKVATQALPAPPPLCPLDFLHLNPGCQVTPGLIAAINKQMAPAANPLDGITADLLAKTLADVTYALALSQQAKNNVTTACWQAWVDVLTAQTKTVTDANGNTLTEPDPHFFTAAERASEFVNQIQPNSPLNVGCGAALNQSKIAVGQMIGAVISGGALGLFKVPGL